MKQSKILREALASGRTIFRPGIALAIHAQMAESLGYEAVGVSTGNLASHIYGLPDVGLVTLTEVAQNVRNITAAVAIPVVVDCDTGFGNAITVRRTVREMIAAGAAGLFFEDQASPKRCGSIKGVRVLPLDEAVGKYRSAVDARNSIDPDFIIMARTDARSAQGLDEAIRRAQAYEAAGVDVIHAESLQSRDEIRALRQAVSIPFTCTANSLELGLDEMQELGICMTMGTMFFKAGLLTIWDLLSQMKQEGLGPYHQYSRMAKTHPMGALGAQQLAGLRQYIEWEREFLPPEPEASESTGIGLDPMVAQATLAKKS